VHNYGAACGIFQNQTIFLIGISILVLGGGYWYRDKIGTTLLSRLGLVFLLGGTMGNLIDRVSRGYVVDFINIHVFPVFNISDMAIDIGVICFIIELVIGHDRRRAT